jgi:GTP-binding protein
MRVKFLKSGVHPGDYPFPYKPEVAIAGRSNAGKSSFINALTGRRIAKVSATPGKTRLLNFFELDEALYMVDMPGYGFATGSRKEVESWKKMVETYLGERKNLRGVLLVMDIRRDWCDEEIMLQEWLVHRDIPMAIILNKADKLSRSAASGQARKLMKTVGNAEVFVISAAKKSGLEDIRHLLFKEWGKA